MTCTRCNQIAPIRMRDTLDWDVPYQLCGGCWDHYCNLDDDEAISHFAIDLWKRAAVQSLAPMGNA
jgi:hypothetical protein